MQALAEIQDAVGRLADDVGPSVVGIGHRWAMGSGVVIAPGKVLTNAHNLRRDRVTVTFSDDRSADGTPLGVDIDGDLAVLEVDTGDVPAIEWGDGAPPLGAPVFALANPGGRGLRVTFGMVSGTARTFRGPRGRRITGSLEHTAPLLPGSSGGPVVDADGRLLGINTNRLGEGFYLAIPASAELKARAEGLGKGESPQPVRLGIGIAPPHVVRRLRRAVGLPEVDGLLVREVEDGSAAADAGLEQGDLITHAEGRELSSFDALHEVLGAKKPGDALELSVLRGTEERTVSVTLR
ncbi:MAG: S1C family serine protease [Actinomycetota bacterium]